MGRILRRTDSDLCDRSSRGEQSVGALLWQPPLFESGIYHSANLPHSYAVPNVHTALVMTSVGIRHVDATRLVQEFDDFRRGNRWINSTRVQGTTEIAEIDPNPTPHVGIVPAMAVSPHQTEDFTVSPNLDAVDQSGLKQRLFNGDPADVGKSDSPTAHQFEVLAIDRLHSPWRIQRLKVPERNRGAGRQRKASSECQHGARQHPTTFLPRGHLSPLVNQISDSVSNTQVIV